MANNSGVNVTHGSVGTTAETSHLTSVVNQVAVTNKHATQTLGVRVFTAQTPTAVQTLAAATAAVEAASEVWYIPPAGGRRVVWRSPRGTYVGLSVVGSAAATTYTTEGTVFFT